MSDTFTLGYPETTPHFTFTDPPPQSLTDRHRPKRLTDIMGQPDVVFHLSRFVETPYAGAMLFEGPTGIGKTTAALALAAELGAVEFGGLFRICSGDQNGDAVADILHNLRFTPMLGSDWKVVIVDEADYMSP